MVAGQRPRKAPRSFPDPGGVVLPWAVGRKTAVTSPAFDPAPAGSDLVGDAFSGGVAPGYCMDPLRGSRMDRSEDVLGGGANCLTHFQSEFRMCESHHQVRAGPLHFPPTHGLAMSPTFT
jgi:hypothetical protein